MSKRFFQCFAVLVCLIVSGLMVSAQVTTATISGTIKDGTGAVLPGVSITVKNLDTGTTRTTITGDDGRYHAPNLMLGNYQVESSLSGFQAAVRTGIELTLGREAVVDFTLKVGEITEKLVVTDEAPLVETTSSTIAGLVSNAQLEALPLNGRSFIELAQLQQGVASSPTAGTGASQGFGKKITVSGTRPYETSFTLDGQDINDAYNFVGSAAGVVAGVDAVREFKVVTNPYSAEYGRMAGGQVQVISKSGTNELHGSVYEFLRNDNLDARNFFDPSRLPEFKRNQFGFSLGAPLVKDKTFLFGNYEALRETLGVTEISVVPDANARLGLLPAGGVLSNIGVNPAVRPYLDLYPLPNLRVFGDGRGEFAWENPRITTEDFFLVRTDHNFNKLFGLGESNSFQARYTIDDSGRDLAQNFAADRVESSRTQYVSLLLDTVVSPRVVNRFQVAYNRSILSIFNTPSARLKAAGNPDILRLANYPQINGFTAVSPGSGVVSIGGDSFNPRLFVLNLYQVREDVTAQFGKHSLKVGANVEKFGNNWLHTFNANGSFTFQNLGNFLRNVPNSFITVHSDSEFFRSFRQWLIGWYVQDDIRVSNRVTLNLGLRHEWITVPTEKWDRLYIMKNYADPKANPLTDPVRGFFENPSLKNFSPRIGFAWDPMGSGKTAIRAGFGVFYSQLINNMWRFPAAQNAPLFKRAEIRSADVPIDFPNAFRTQKDLLGGSIAVQGVEVEPDQPTTLQFSLNIQRELAADTVLTLEYSGSRGYSLQRVSDFNMRVPERLADGRLFFSQTAQIFNPAAERLWINTYDVDSFYDAFRIGITRRFANDFGFQISYNFAKSIDDQSNMQGATDFNNERSGPPRETPPGFRLPATDARGLSSFDVRQNFVTNFTYNLPVGSGRAWPVSGAADKIFGGWSVNGILRLSDGAPFDVNGSRASNIRTFARWGDVIVGSPNLVSGRNSNSINPQNPDRYFDPSAFELPAPGFFGNLGRHALISPGFSNFDLSLSKKTAIMRERASLEFRAEFFNLFNRANFSLPANNIFDPGTFAVRPDAGRITSTSGTSRQIQFALRIVF